MIETLSALRGIRPGELIVELTSSLKDIIQVRFLGADLSGSIRFDLASRFLARASKLLGAAACAESKPSAYFMKSTALSKEFVENCRLAHTVTGSFGFRIESPLDQTASVLGTLTDAERPFRRRVLERLMHGLRLAEDAVLTQDPGRITTEYGVGLNANMCESLMEIADLAGDKEAEFSAQWSPLVTPRYRGGSVKVGSRWHPVLAAASSSLREVPLLKRVSVLGKIVALRSGAAPVDDGYPEHHLVQIESREHGRRITVRITMSAYDYRQACDAHRDGQTVAVQGVLEKQGKLWVLSSPSQFHVVPPEQLLFKGGIEDVG
ncbi:hypothetical protein IV102_33320 [bacterium]|nr:hypothetical protein [bacterium]